MRRPCLGTHSWVEPLHDVGPDAGIMNKGRGQLNGVTEASTSLCDPATRLNVRQLEAFRAMMLAGTTQGAAELVGLSQPAVSRLVDAFERSLAPRLFERTRNRLPPTPEAHLLFAEVERAFTGVERIREFAALPALAFGLMPRSCKPSGRAIPVRPSSSSFRGARASRSSRPTRASTSGSPRSRSRAPAVVLLPATSRSPGAVLSPADLARESLVALPRTSLSRRSLGDPFARWPGLAPDARGAVRGPRRQPRRARHRARRRRSVDGGGACGEWPGERTLPARPVLRGVRASPRPAPTLARRPRLPRHPAQRTQPRAYARTRVGRENGRGRRGLRVEHERFPGYLGPARPHPYSREIGFS